MIFLNEEEKSTEFYYQAYEKGFEDGYEEGIISIYNKTENCYSVPIFVNNQSKNLIDSSCIISNNTIP